MLAEADRRTIDRGINPAVTDSFAIEYKVRPAEEKVTIRHYEAELVSEYRWHGRITRKVTGKKM